LTPGVDVARLLSTTGLATEREDQFDIEFFDVTDRRGKGLALR
jgi:hypothetical protein